MMPERIGGGLIGARVVSGQFGLENPPGGPYAPRPGNRTRRRPNNPFHREIHWGYLK